MTSIQMTEHHEQPTAGLRDRVPMSEIADFFGRAFQDTMAALQEQGLQPAGPPFGKYYGLPDATVDVEAGFPVSAAIAPAGNIIPGLLPGGRTVEATHIGSYDTMEETYAAVERYFAEQNLTPGDVMWESYLSGPGSEPDTAKWRTQICWPVA